MQGSQTWRELLGKRIKDPQERQRIANELGISQITLVRWTNGESKPRPQNLRLLFLALPDSRQQFLELFIEEFGPSFADSLENESISDEVPSVFYARVMHAYCSLPKILHFNSICDIVLQQALKQLDPNRVGVEIVLVKCMPPSQDNRVRSLRMSMSQSTFPEGGESNPRLFFFGSESLAGYVVSTGRARSIQKEQGGGYLLPIRWEDWEESAIAYPIIMSDSIAGCLLVSSSQPDFFLLPSRQKLVQQYAELITPAFALDEFYKLEKIMLGHMPPSEVQLAYLSSFRNRISDIMINSHIDSIQAENLVLRQIEEELLHHFSQVQES